MLPRAAVASRLAARPTKITGTFCSSGGRGPTYSMPAIREGFAAPPEPHLGLSPRHDRPHSLAYPPALGADLACDAQPVEQVP